MTTTAIDEPHGTRNRTARLVGVALVVVLSASLLLWAKWVPYTAKAKTLSASGHWSGRSILSGAGIDAGSSPSWHAAWSFTVDYGLAVWKALLAALLIAAALQSLIPRGWLASLLSRRHSVTSALSGGFASMPSMMCTCCTAPVAVSLRRCGAPTSAVLAYWMGNPLLNPAVLVFLSLVAPWQWVVTRGVVGLFLVVGGSTVITRFAGRRTIEIEGSDDAGEYASRPAEDTFDLTWAPARFAQALLRLAFVLVPEYFVVVLLVGGFGGWLFPLNGSAHQPVATAAAIVLGTLFVIPTAGEIPLTQGLSAAGFSLSVIGALLVTLPAVSLPSLVMVGRALTWRVTVAAACAVAVGGAAASLLLTSLT